MKTVFIFNPKSGVNRSAPFVQASVARRFLAHCGWPGQVVPTQRAGHATELARQAVEEGYELVVAIGGDGTMNEIASALVGTSVMFGLIPCGSGNGLGRHLGIRGPGRGAYRTLRGGRVLEMDVGLINGRPFFNVAGLGFEADIAAAFASLKRRGLMGYVRAGAKCWRGHRPLECTLRGDGFEQRLAVSTLAVANGSQYGNNARIAPGAAVDDGQLNVTALPPLRWHSLLPAAMRLFGGSINRQPGAFCRSVRTLEIQTSHPVPSHVDGEPLEPTNQFHFEVRPRSLRVLVAR